MPITSPGQLRIELTAKAPHPAQKQILAEAQRFNVVACGRRWGKTEMGIEHLALPTFLAGAPVGWFAPTYKLLDEAWSSTIEVLAPMMSVLEVSKVDHRIRGPNGGVIDFWTLAGATADSSKAGRGRKYKRVIIDEAAHARYLEADWTKAIRPTLADLEGDSWFLSTPKGRNYFHRLWSRDTKGWKSWRFPTSTNPFIKPSEIEEARNSLPKDAYEQEYLAEFLANAANPFGVEAIHRQIAPLSGGIPATVAWGVDLAKSQDWTVAHGLDADGRTAAWQRWQSDWHMTTERLIGMIKGIPAQVDATGVGNPIVELLQRRCPAVEGFSFTAQSKQMLMEGLAMAIQRGEVWYPDGVIVHELESFEYEYRPGGVRYSAPEGMHDDCVCALALAVECLRRRTAGGLQMSVAGSFDESRRMDLAAWLNEDDDDL